MEVELTLQELPAAVQQTSVGKSPGLDGLPAEFYRDFWGFLGPDLLEVYQEAFGEHMLPSRCRGAVLSLLPQTGDLGLLKNWRPVSQCLDYMILSTCLANRLKLVLDSIVHRDQSYCVPGRSLMDNIFLMRDVIDWAKLGRHHSGFCQLIKKKTLDRKSTRLNSSHL